MQTHRRDTHVYIYIHTHAHTEIHVDIQTHRGTYMHIYTDEHTLESFPQCWKALVEKFFHRMQTH